MQQSQRDFQRERSRVVSELVDEIQGVVTEYAKANGFSLILDQQALLYSQGVPDITEEILKLLNTKYAAQKGRR